MPGAIDTVRQAMSDTMGVLQQTRGQFVNIRQSAAGQLRSAAGAGGIGGKFQLGGMQIGGPNGFLGEIQKRVGQLGVTSWRPGKALGGTSAPAGFEKIGSVRGGSMSPRRPTSYGGFEEIGGRR